jgi:hypothetical protein
MAECEPSFIKKPLVLVRPFTVFPASACGNNILNVLIRICLIVGIIGCLAFMIVPTQMYTFMALSFVILLAPTVYTLFTDSDSNSGESVSASASASASASGSGSGSSRAEGFLGATAPKFLQFSKPSPNPILAAEEKGIATVIPCETGAPWTQPTAANPFMNILLTDLKEPNKWRPAVVSAFDAQTKQQLDDFFRIQWFSDPTDVFGKNQGQRQFYTMPSTSIPNDRQSYQNWLYKIPGKICKEGNGAACLPGTDGGPIPWLNKDS